MNKRRWMVLAGIVFVAIVAGLGIKSIFDARASNERQTLYTAALKDYSDALVPGTSRREVEAYLRQRHHSYRQMCCVADHRSAYADLVKVGQEKAPWFCNQNNMYIALEFDASEPHGPIVDARDSDRLLGTKLFPWLEECL